VESIKPSLQELEKWLRFKWYVLGVLFSSLISYMLAGIGIGSGTLTMEFVLTWIAVGVPILVIGFYEPTASQQFSLMGRIYSKAINTSYDRTAHLGLNKAIRRICALPLLLLLAIVGSYLFIMQYSDKWWYGILIGIGISKLAQYGVDEELGAPKEAKDIFSMIIIPLVFILFLVPYVIAEYKPDFKEKEIYKIVELGFIVLLPLVIAGALAVASIMWSKLIGKIFKLREDVVID
jgi:hypothetical protein